MEGSEQSAEPRSDLGRDNLLVDCETKPYLGMGARKFDGKTPVTLVKSEAGWTLIAREGRPLGFVATKDLVPLQ